PGWAAGVGWHDEPVSFEEMPHLENPLCGYLATANNRPTPEGEGPFLSADFIDGYRVTSISRALAARRDWDIPSTMALQMDQHAVAWQEMRELVLSAQPLDETAQQALELLRGWDGDTSAGAPAAVYELFVAEMVSRVAQAKAPGSWRWVVGAPLS